MLHPLAVDILEQFRDVAYTLGQWTQKELAKSGLVPPPPFAPSLAEVIEALAQLNLLTEQENALYTGSDAHAENAQTPD